MRGEQISPAGLLTAVAFLRELHMEQISQREGLHHEIFGSVLDRAEMTRFLLLRTETTQKRSARQPVAERPGSSFPVNRRRIENSKGDTENMTASQQGKHTADTVEMGRINRLRIIRRSDAGVWLDGRERGEIFMPRRYAGKDIMTGDDVDVFIFPDTGNQFLATTKRPYAMIGEYALLTVAAVTPVGAFLDWGLEKDLLVPFSEQKEKMEEGRSYIVHVHLDKRTNRIVASSKLNRFMSKQPAGFAEGQSVDLLICTQTEIGYKAIIDNTRWGILYKNEVFQPLKKGQRLRGFIKNVRDDGKIDLCLQLPGYAQIEGAAEKIIGTLKSQGGFIRVTDKSPSAIIYSMFGMSKKTYKKAIGSLYKRRLIAIEEHGIRLR